MDVKDLRITDVRAIANRHASDNKKLNWLGWYNIIGYICCVLFVVLFTISAIQQGNARYVYTDKEGNHIYTDSKYITPFQDNGNLYIYDKSATNEEFPVFPLYWSLIPGVGMMITFMKVYYYDRASYRNKFMQYWKDNGKLPEDKDIGY